MTKVLLVHPVHLVTKAQSVHPDNKAQWELKVLKVLKVSLVTKEQLVTKVLKEIKEFLEIKD